MVGWRAAGARAVLRRLGAAVAKKQDGRVFSASYSSSCSRSANAPFGLGQYTNLLRAHTLTSREIPSNFHQLIRNAGISTTRNLLAEDNAMVPVSSPLTSPLGNAEETDKKGVVVKKLKVQAIKKDIKQRQSRQAEAKQASRSAAHTHTRHHQGTNNRTWQREAAAPGGGEAVPCFPSGRGLHQWEESPEAWPQAWPELGRPADGGAAADLAGAGEVA